MAIVPCEQPCRPIYWRPITGTNSIHKNHNNAWDNETYSLIIKKHSSTEASNGQFVFTPTNRLVFGFDDFFIDPLPFCNVSVVIINPRLSRSKLYSICLIFTAGKRSCGKVMLYTCLSFCSRRGVIPPRQTPNPWTDIPLDIHPRR